MSDQHSITLPKLGESILSATVVQWFKKVGDPVQLDEALLEVSTDKINSEIPSPVAGILTEICAAADQEVKVGDPLAVITTGAQLPAPKAEQKGFLSPAVLRMARENGIGLDELDQIEPTGAGGRVTKQDVEKLLSSPRAPQGDVERLKMSGMRKAIADNMVRSFYEAPHATLITEVDVTHILKNIQTTKEEFFDKYGAKLTITAYVAQAIGAAIKEFPLINSSLEKDTIIVKKFVNLGIAVSVEQGLIVPVVKNCERLDLPGIAQAIGDVSLRARMNKLLPEDVTEGTITMTNFGMSGIQIGVPIIRYPEVAIVGIGAICKRVVPMEDDTLSVRSMMHISLTFDHRVLDGMYGCGFLNALKTHLQSC